MRRGVIAAALVLGFFSAGVARAESPKWFSAELGVAGERMNNDDVRLVYGKKDHPAFHGRAGFLLKSILDIGVSGDFFQESGKRVGTAGGGTSGEPTRLTLAPFAATALIRLDVLPNQPIVPYGGGGIAYAMWQERSIFDNKNLAGDKYGWTALGGAMILLDTFEQGRAADLDSWWGVNDTFLQFEISETKYDRLGKGQQGLDLAHVSAHAAFLFEF